MKNGASEIGMDLKKVEQLARFIQYVIGHRPDEFGLVADDQGFLPVRDVLRVLQDEGWSHIRRNHLETLDYHIGKATIEIQAHLLRARDRSRLADLHLAATPPKLLHAPIRRRAYEAVLQHGLRPQGHLNQVVLFSDPEFAQKVGQRRDAQPVIVTVNVQTAIEQGCRFQPFGKSIFMTEQLPAACCRMPRPPKAAKPHAVEPPPPDPAPKTPGSFLLSIDPVENGAAPKRPPRGRRGAKDWKRERRKARRWKENPG